MIFIGIDPGLHGYIASLNHAGSVSFFQMPVVPKTKGARAFDIGQLLRQLKHGYQSCGGVCKVVLERQQAFPQQGGVSNFTTGFGYGMLKTALRATGFTFQEVMPRVWKKAFGIKGSRRSQKLQAIALAMELYPGVDLKPTERGGKPRVPCHDKAEALLLAIFAKNSYHAAEMVKA